MLKSKKMVKKNLKNTEFISRVLNVSRVSKTTSGGRRMSISVLVVIGNEDGVFGFGLGNDMEMKAAENKALRMAQNNLFSVPLKRIRSSSGLRRTLYHATSGKWCSTKVDMFSARPGTGIVASPAVSSICECLGITDVVSKIHASSNPHNVVKAVKDALMKVRTSEYYKYLLGLSVSENV